MKNLLIIILFSITIISCKKNQTEEPDPNALPPVTQTGANILACKVNGQTHIYSTLYELFAENGVNVTRYKENNETYWSITARDNRYNDYIEIIIYITGDTLALNKEYDISNEKKDRAIYQLNNTNDKYRTKLNTGSVVFTKNADHIIAGKFSFTAINSNGVQVELSEGFFDIRSTQ